MRDISELPGDTEQAKPTTSPKPRTPARPKPENTAAGSQEQENKPAPRRRTPSTAPTNTTTTSPQEIENSTTAAPAHPAPAQQNTVPTQQNATTPPARPAPAQQNTAPTQQNATTPPARPAPAQQNTAPTQRTNNNTTAGSTPPAPRTGTSAPDQQTNPPRTGTPPYPQGPRPAGNGPYQQGGPRPGGSYQQGPRPGGNGPYQRNNAGGPNPRPPVPGQQGGYRPNNGPIRPGGNGPQPANGGPRPAPAYRSGPPNTQQRPEGGRPAPQRTFSTPDKAPGQSTYSSQRSSGSRSGTRTGGGSSSSPTRTSGGGNGERNHTANVRPGARTNGTNAPRTQERRVAIVKEKVTGPISLPPQIVVKDLAELLNTSPIEIIRDLINKHAIFASINQVVEYEKAALVAKDLGFEPSLSAMTIAPAVRSERGEIAQSANEAMIASRGDGETMETIPPVVTIMGHVDHGKTSLLDVIRKTKVAAGEAGGITQHIGAYQVEVNSKKITFLDTPGHEAFTAMRARGAQVAHIAIIVVAADDGVMPQTREAIDHARAAKMPIIIAVNKIDKANANPDRVKQQLAEIGVVIEEYGGETVCVPISARKAEGIDELLDYILLVAEVQDIRANPNRLATGVIIEAKLEKNSGVTATVLVQQGTLKMGDNIVVGGIAGKIRAMFNDRGKRIQKAPPSTPVSILGLSEVPQAGDRLEVTPDERTAKVQAQQEAEKRREEIMPLGQVSLDTLYMQMQEGKVKELNIILKCDVQGSSEAIKGSLSKLGEDNMKVRLIHEGIGNISETDVHLAGASKTVIIGFNVKADGAAVREAQKEGVDIRYYNVIYKLIDDIQAALVGMLEPTYREVVDGHAEVIQIFKAGKNLVIAGCRITDGKLTRSSQARVMRKAEKVHEGKIGSLRRGKDDVREVATGYECGIVLEDFNEYEVGDIIEAFSQERVLTGA